MEGDVSKVKFYYDLSGTGVYQPFKKEKVQIISDNTKHTVTLTYPESLTDTEHDVKLKAELGVKVIEKSFKIEDPELTLSLKNGDADVWAKHVDFQVTSTTDDGWVATADNVEILSLEDNVWKNVAFSYDNGQFAVSDLTSDKDYTFRVIDKNDATKGSAFVNIHTEKDLQVPNGEMEDWYYTRPSGVQYWEVWYACKDGEQPVWNTLNQLTTSEGGTNTNWFNRNGCRYSANSGTIQTNDVNSENFAALIRTVGWGGGNSAAAISGMGTCENVTPGELYLGTYNVENHKPEYGYAFTSRPMAVQFMYKYIPKNSADWFVVTVEVKDDTGSVIAAKTVTKTGAVAAYTQEVVRLEYNAIKKAATLSIVFKSSGNESCWEANTNNLTPPPARNLSDGEYLGSQLYIDDVELIYE